MEIHNVDVVSDSEADEITDYCTPPDISNIAKEVTSNLLPTKSREKYNLQYKLFMDWCSAKKITRYSENVILAYLSELAAKYKCSTLWSIYSMLKSTLAVKDNVDIGSYTKVVAYLKKLSNTVYVCGCVCVCVCVGQKTMCRPRR